MSLKPGMCSLYLDTNIDEDDYVAEKGYPEYFDTIMQSLPSVLDTQEQDSTDCNYTLVSKYSWYPFFCDIVSQHYLYVTGFGKRDLITHFKKIELLLP